MMEFVDPIVPYSDREVKEVLRMLEEPIVVFGETIPERRQRLRKHMIEKGHASFEVIRERYHCQGSTDSITTSGNASGTVRDGANIEERSSEASTQLVEKRMALLPLSLQLAERRIAKLKEAFVARSAVRLAHHSTMEKLRRMRLTKSVRNVKVINEEDRRSASASGTVSEYFCLPLTCCVAITAMEHTVVTGAVNGIVTVWDTSTCRPLGSVSSCQSGWGRVRYLAAHPNQPLFFSITMFDLRIATWRISSLSSGEVSSTDQLNSAAGKSGGSAGTKLALENVALGPTRHTAGINRIAVDPSGTCLASTSKDSTVCLWDIDSGVMLLPLVSLCGYEDVGGALDVRFHPDCSLLATTDKAGRAVVWDVRSGAVAFVASGTHGGHLQASTCLSWSPCGFRFATGGADNLIHIWDARYLCRGAAEAPSIFVGHDDVVTSVEFFPNQSFSVIPAGFVSTSLDGTVRVWDINAVGTCVQALQGPSPVYGQCWPTGGEGNGPTLLTVAHSKYWSLWNCVTEGMSCSVACTETEEIVVSGAVGLKRNGAVKNYLENDEKEGIEESEEEDEMLALRKRGDITSEEKVLNGDVRGGSDDEDEMLLLKRK